MTAKRCTPAKKSKPKERFSKTSEGAETSTTCNTTGHSGQLITLDIISYLDE